MGMKRVDIYIKEDQFYYIGNLSGTLSEHVRRALDDYIQTLKAKETSTSASKGVSHG